MKLKITFLLMASVSLCQCLKILVIFPHFGKSHYLVYEPLFKNLSSKGHNLTVIGFFPQQNKIPNFRDVVVKSGRIAGEGIMNMEKIEVSRWELYRGPNLLAWFAEISCPLVLNSTNVLNFLQEKNTFDVILVEYFHTNCVMGIVKKFSAPIISKFLLFYLYQKI